MARGGLTHQIKRARSREGQPDFYCIDSTCCYFGYIVNDIQQTVRTLLGTKGISLADLANGIGLSLPSIEDLVQGRLYSHRRVRKIEKFLGGPVWTPIQRFEELNRASDLLGADAVLAGFHELRRRAHSRAAS